MTDLPAVLHDARTLVAARFRNVQTVSIWPAESDMQLRPFCPEDRAGVIALIDGVYREYGDRICLENADGDLLDIPRHYWGAGGAFVVLEEGGHVAGSHAVLPLVDQPGRCTFRRLYLAAELRGGDWGRRLMDWALDWAVTHAFQRVEFWSDTRFRRAHGFFERFGFQRDGRARELSDGNQPYCEYFFFRDLTTTDEAARREGQRDGNFSPAQ